MSLAESYESMGPASRDIAHAMTGAPEDYINDQSIELAWAMKTYDNARIHMNLICAVKARELAMSTVDGAMYEEFRKLFPKLEIRLIDEVALKSDEMKQKWRAFIDQFKDDVEDFNFGSLLRIDCRKRYDSDNTVIVPRLQFLAIEIARNREGLNDDLGDVFKPGTESDE